VIKYREFTGIFVDENDLLKKTDVDALKCRDQLGLDTLLVYTLNYEYLVMKRPKLTRKYSAWAVQSQGWNLTELAGICSNGGICGLMR
jgi:hypothetical protein